MATVVVVESLSDLKERIVACEDYKKFGSSLKLRLTHDGYDERIKWDCYLVSLVDEKGTGLPIGFTNGLLS